METRRFRRNENGAVLLTVLCIMTMMIILVSAAILFVNQTTQKTYRTFQAEQAYMTASSSLESFVQQIENDTNSATATDKDSQQKAIEYLEQLANENGGKGYEYDVLINNKKDIERMGSCTIRVSRFNANTIIITSTAKFGSETDQCAAYVYTETQPKRATFTNAIEICQDCGGDFNNLNVLGDMATLRGDNKTQNYSATNQFKVYGSSYLYGNMSARGNGSSITSFLMPSRTQDAMGSSFTISGDFTTNNDYLLKTTVDWGLGYNYLNVGETFTVSDSQPEVGGIERFGTVAATVGKNANKDIDIFCHNAKFNGSSFKLQGNLCVYRNDGEEGNNGNLIVQNSNGMEIWGDVFVDGDIYASQQNGAITVHGTVQVCGNVKRSAYDWTSGGVVDTNLTFANGATEVKSSDGQVRIRATGGVSKVDSITKEGRTKRPEIAQTLMEYKYFPEDFLMSDKSENGTTVGMLKNQYTAFYNGVNTLTLGSIAQAQGSTPYTYTDENGVVSKYKCCVTESCTVAPGDFEKCRQAGDGQNASKILVHITDEDILIRLQEGAPSQFNVNFVVKNDSPSDNPHFCYFVSDSGISGTQDSSKLDANGHNKVGINSWDGFDTKTYEFNNCGWFDYYTYVNMFNDSVLNSCSGTLVDNSGIFRDGFILNSTSEEVPGTYTPKPASTVFLFTKGNTLQLENASFMEAVFYGPDADYRTATQGVNGVTVHTADGDRAWKICSLGMVIAGNFYNKNESAYLFKAPQDGGVLAIAKGARQDNLYGYKLLRYDHH